MNSFGGPRGKKSRAGLFFARAARCFAALSLAVSAASCRDAAPARGSTVRGYGGPLTLSAEADDDGGFALTVVSHSETAGIGDLALKSVVEKMNDKQTLAVDALSGATVTSSAAVACAEKELAAKGFDVELLKSRREDDINIEYIYLSCDVAIVGAGGAGLMAAIKAAGAGADVMVFEKLSVVGGSTARSDGKIMAAGTDVQRSNLVDDSATLFASYLYDCSNGLADSDRLMSLAESSAGNLDFLRTLGVPIGRGLESSGGAKRVHLISDSDNAGGGLMIEPLLKCAEALGVEILTDAEVVELTTAATGRVTGLRASLRKQDILVVSAGAVILATGGFDHNEALVKEVIGGVDCVSMSGLGSDGDGLALAAAAGAKLLEEPSLVAEICDLRASAGLCDGILVTPRGTRFCDESGDGFEMYERLRKRGFSESWLIVDASRADPMFAEAELTGHVVSAESIAQLADRLGAESLETTVEKYNDICGDGVDYMFGRDASTLKKISGSKYFAVRCGLRSYGTLGGVVVNRSCEAQSEYGSIEGLYAAGELVNGNYFADLFPGFGSQLAVALETASIAGVKAADYALSQG